MRNPIRKALFLAMLLASIFCVGPVSADECSGGEGGHLCNDLDTEDASATAEPIPSSVSSSWAKKKPQQTDQDTLNKQKARPTAAKDGTDRDRQGGDGPSDPALTQQVEACEGAATSAAADCSADKSNGTLAQATDQVNSAAKDIKRSKGAEACARLDSAIQSASSAMSSMRATCNASYNRCVSSCNIPVTTSSPLYDRYVRAKTSCNGASSLVAKMDGDMAKFQAEQSKANKCQEDASSSSSDFGNMASSLAQQAISMLNQQPACADASCGMPTLPNNAANPYNNTNTNSNTASNPIGDAGGDSDFATNTGGGLSNSFGGGGNSAFEPPPFDRPPANGGAGSGKPPGSFGDGMSGGKAQGANKPGPKERPGRAASTINTNILGGRVGGAPGSAFAAAAAKDPNGGTVTKEGSWIPPKVSPQDDPRNLNLDRFRPNVQGYRLPTAVAKNASELLGSHVDIWKQVNLRYLSISFSLTP